MLPALLRALRLPGVCIALLAVPASVLAPPAPAAEPVESPPPDAPGEIPLRHWQLSTGSRIGYVHIAAPESRGARMVIFLHGGPGACEVYAYAFARAWFEQLARLGFDVYLYDQIGSGSSDRLSNPRHYTLARHVADLEAIRREIGRERLILIGESHGATLSAAYIAAHPHRAERAIFVAPGFLEPAVWKARIHPSSSPRIAPEFLQWIEDTRGRDARQRYQKLDTLLQHDVAAAHAFAGDAEMDLLMDAWVNDRIIITCVHDKTRLAERHFTLRGMGWWASLMTNWDEVNLRSSIRRQLITSDVPVLILRGDSDYLPQRAAEDYASTFPQARLIRIPAAGHFIWLDQPQRYRDEIISFLAPPPPPPGARPTG